MSISRRLPAYSKEFIHLIYIVMNLSKIKKVGFIDNFNRRGSYPEFGSVVKTVEKAPVAAKVIKHKLGNPELIAAKKEFNRTKPVGYKPRVLVSTKF